MTTPTEEQIVAIGSMAGLHLNTSPTIDRNILVRFAALLLAQQKAKPADHIEDVRGMVADQRSDEQVFKAAISQYAGYEVTGPVKIVARHFFQRGIQHERQRSGGDAVDAHQSDNLHIRMDWKDAHYRQVITSMKLDRAIDPAYNVSEMARAMFIALDAAIKGKAND